MEFFYHTPTKIYFGEGCIRHNASAISGLGKKPLIVTGHHSAKASGALDDILDALGQNGQGYAVYDSVEPNPTVDMVYDGVRKLKEEACDCVIAIGGGSPMDTGKAIALAASQDIPREKLFSSKYSLEVMPIVAVPTTAGTGSEVTKGSIITNDEAKTKSAITFEGIYPAVAYCDGRYLSGLSHRTMVNTVVDALSHAIEGYLGSKADPITDVLAEKSIRTIITCMDDLESDSLDDTELQALLLASTLAGLVIANTGTSAVHAMGYELTYFRHIDHGRANGLLLAALFRFYQRKGVSRLSDVIGFMGMKDIDEFASLMDRLLGEKEQFTDDELQMYASIAIKAGNIANSIVPPDEAELLEMYREIG